MCSRPFVVLDANGIVVSHPMLCSAPWLPTFRLLLDLLGIPAIAVPKQTPIKLSKE